MEKKDQYFCTVFILWVNGHITLQVAKHAPTMNTYMYNIIMYNVYSLDLDVDILHLIHYDHPVWQTTTDKMPQNISLGHNIV